MWPTQSEQSIQAVSLVAARDALQNLTVTAADTATVFNTTSLQHIGPHLTLVCGARREHQAQRFYFIQVV